MLATARFTVMWETPGDPEAFDRHYRPGCPPYSLSSPSSQAASRCRTLAVRVQVARIRGRGARLGSLLLPLTAA
jgi:hypothetical protein